MKDNYAALIPVRGGSKSIPLKNIKEINGRPLVYWTIDAAVQCRKIEHVYVSTDSPLIKSCVERYKIENTDADKLECIDRAPETATDQASTESVMADFTNRYDYENIILIQATSPLLDAVDLDNAIEKYENEKCGGLLSVVRQKRFIWADTDDGFIPQNYDFLKRPRRQEFDGFFVENGAFYITSRERFLDSGCRISGKIGAYEMREETYFEIDEISDWIIVEKLLREKNKAKVDNAAHIKLFVTDCDGCLTDGGMYYSETGDEMKRFNTLDGMGLALLKEKGIKTAIITGENTRIAENRAKKLKIDYLYQGIKNKLQVLSELIEKEGISFEEVAYVGDDINDLQCIESAGIGFTVPNGHHSIKAAADIILKTEGGKGAIREAAEIILNNL